MKKTILSIITISSICLLTIAQTAPEMPRNDDGDVNYTGTVELEDATKVKIFQYFNVWAQKFFTNPKSAIKKTDGEKAWMQGQHKIRMFNTASKKGGFMGNVTYTFELQAEEGGYSYNIYKINKDATSYTGIEEFFDKKDKNWKINYGYLNQVDDFMNNFVDDLFKTMETTPRTAKKEAEQTTKTSKVSPADKATAPVKPLEVE